MFTGTHTELIISYPGKHKEHLVALEQVAQFFGQAKQLYSELAFLLLK